MDNDEIDDGRIRYYYSREERLKKATQAVRDLNKPFVAKKRGLFRTLTATKPLTFLFISIVTICVAMLIFSRFLLVEGVRMLGNNTVAVSVIGAGEKSYITVKKTAPHDSKRSSGTDDTYSGPVDIAVSIPGEGNPIHAERVYFGPEQEETFRFAAPFRGKKLLFLMEAGNERVTLTVTAE